MEDFSVTMTQPSLLHGNPYLCGAPRTTELPDLQLNLLTFTTRWSPWEAHSKEHPKLRFKGRDAVVGGSCGRGTSINRFTLIESVQSDGNTVILINHGQNCGLLIWRKEITLCPENHNISPM